MVGEFVKLKVSVTGNFVKPLQRLCQMVEKLPSMRFEAGFPACASPLAAVTLDTFTNSSVTSSLHDVSGPWRTFNERVTVPSVDLNVTTPSRA